VLVARDNRHAEDVRDVFGSETFPSIKLLGEAFGVRLPAGVGEVHDQ
jgi:hypothetical protein